MIKWNKSIRKLLIIVGAIAVFSGFLSACRDVKYTIGYQLNGGSWGVEQVVNEFKAGDEINLTNPVKEEFEFIGWYLDEVFTDTKKVINTKDLPNNNITLYAKWASIKYTIGYQLNGGSWGVEQVVNEFKAGDEINLTNPVKEEFEFIGWYLDEVFTDTKKVINTKDLPNNNITLYAKWASIKYTIGYQLNGGSWGVEQVVNEFKAGDEINLTNPVKEEFEFIGWYLDEIFTDTKK